MSEDAPVAAVKSDNPNRKVEIQKVVAHISSGEPRDKLKKAERVLGVLTARKPVRTIAKATIRDWGLRKGMQIGCKVTLRKKGAEDFLKRALWVRNFKLLEESFDERGNISFGIPDYTGFEGVKYDPDIGIFGLDVCVTLRRKGSRVALRKYVPSKMHKRQYVTKDEAIMFFKAKFKVEVVE
jgi:large subunit ribosomal protein L5